MIRKVPSADLRRAYRRTFEVALSMTLLLVIAAFKFFPDPEQSRLATMIEPDLIVAEDIPVTNHLRRPPPPSRPPVVIEAPDAEPLVDLPINSDLRTDLPVPPPILTEEEYYFEVVEELPQPIGGFAALVRTLRYPDLARRIGIEGTVVVLAYVDEMGIVTRTEILKGIGFGCDEEAMSAVAKTRFQPGSQRGKPVKVKVKIPVRFRLGS